MRKRISWRWLGHYKLWRVAHAAIGLAALAVLFFHTGFNLGSNLNRWLMVTFLAVAVAGSVTGIVTAREHTALAAGRSSYRAALHLAAHPRVLAAAGAAAAARRHGLRLLSH